MRRGLRRGANFSELKDLTPEQLVCWDRDVDQDLVGDAQPRVYKDHGTRICLGPDVDGNKYIIFWMEYPEPHWHVRKFR